MQVCSDFAVSALPVTENFVVSRVISRFICDKRATWRLWGGGGENGKIVSFFSSNKGLLTVVVSST